MFWCVKCDSKRFIDMKPNIYCFCLIICVILAYPSNKCIICRPYFITKRLQYKCFLVNIGNILKPPILKNICIQLQENLGSDCLGLSFWRVIFKTIWLSNITKIPVVFKPDPSLNLTSMLYFGPRFPMFIINGYDSKASGCSPWSCCSFSTWLICINLILWSNSSCRKLTLILPIMLLQRIAVDKVYHHL